MKKRIFICFLSLILILNFVSLAFAAAATMYVTPAGAGVKDGTTWAKAMGYAEWETDFEGASEAGDIYYVAGGTYTLTSALDANARSGTSNAPISAIGVKAGTTNEPPINSDWATGDDRPLIAGGSYFLRTGSYWKVSNIRWTGTGTYGILIDNSYSTYYNCKVSGSMAQGMRLGTESNIIFCEITTTNVAGYAIRFLSNSSYRFLFNYIHDCVTGIAPGTATNSLFAFNVFDTCSSYGILGAIIRSSLFFNNTFYNCATGIYDTTGYNNVFINNVFNDCATAGASWGTQENTNVWINNNFEGCGANVNVASTLPHSDWLAKTFDPLFTNDAGGDFSLQAASQLINNALGLTLGTSINSKMAIGAWQKEIVAGSSGGGIWGLIR